MSETVEEPPVAEVPPEPPPVSPENPSATAGGSAETGWIVDVSDGDRHDVFRVDGADEKAAIAAALKLFAKAPPPVEDPLMKALAEFKKAGDKAIADFKEAAKDALDHYKPKSDDKKK